MLHKMQSRSRRRSRWSSVLPGPCRERRLDRRPLAARLGFLECLFRRGLFGRKSRSLSNGTRPASLGWAVLPLWRS
jgi:hypothetical protein